MIEIGHAVTVQRREHPGPRATRAIPADSRMVAAAIVKPPDGRPGPAGRHGLSDAGPRSIMSGQRRSDSSVVHCLLAALGWGTSTISAAMALQRTRTYVVVLGSQALGMILLGLLLAARARPARGSLRDAPTALPAPR